MCGPDSNDLQSAKAVLERVALHHGVLQKLVMDDADDEVSELSRLTCLFYTLRMRDAWLHKSSLLELMYVKAADERAAREDAHTGEQLARAADAVARDMLADKTLPLAIMWLRRAFEVLARIEASSLSDAGSELRSDVVHAIGSTASVVPCNGSLTNVQPGPAWIPRAPRISSSQSRRSTVSPRTGQIG